VSKPEISCSSRSYGTLIMLRLGMVTAVIFAAGCQLLAPHADDQPALRQPASEPERLINRSSRPSTSASARAAAPELTTSVQRGTLQERIVLPGQVVSGRSSQLSFRTGGTVRAVNVRSGQTVQRGQTLAELSLDEASLQSARA